MLAAQWTDDQIAVIGCAVVFVGCILMMMLSQKVGDAVRNRGTTGRERIMPFPATAQRTTEDQTGDRRAA